MILARKKIEKCYQYYSSSREKYLIARKVYSYRAINIKKPPLKVQIGRFSSNVSGGFLIFFWDSQIGRGGFLINPLFWCSIFDHFLVFLHCKTLKNPKFFLARFARNLNFREGFLMFFQISEFERGEFLMFFEICEFERGEFLVRGAFLILIAR